ncbi:MAG: hypothetical protein AMJ54_04465 [Deltaproteobacteria bacterium SG8_13]|nr:MAG: hypothetical protein AMJ54_04465 [Deltaproteobacteria bacterium SG8_13]
MKSENADASFQIQSIDSPAGIIEKMDATIKGGNMDTAIHKEFRALFHELEIKHLDIRKRLNAITIDGEALEERLKKEIADFEIWRFPIMDRLGEISQNFSELEKSRHQEYIRKSKYFKIIQEAPFYWRIINKPNGYSGDAEMMSYIYRDSFEGDTPFGKFLHKHAVSTKACQAVRNRKEYLTDQIMQKTGKFLSLAAGPSKEIMEVMDTTNNGRQFLALDHDLETLVKYRPQEKTDQFTYALANAFQFISGNYFAARPRGFFERYCSPRTDFTGLHKLFSFIKYEMIELSQQRFDMIYSAGLYDYIKTFQLDDSKGTVGLTKSLFDLLHHDGLLIVGNFNKNNPRDLVFVMEYVYDWQLIYRDRVDLKEFARSIDEKEIKNIEIIEEPLGINYFLKIEKV